MKYNSVFYESDLIELKEPVEEITTLRNKLVIDQGMNMPWSVTRPWEYAKLIKASQPLIHHGSVLDIGSANSVLPFYFNDRDCMVQACDIEMPSAKELDYYKRCAIGYKRADILNLPYKKETFDYVFSVCVLEHIYPFKDDDDIVRETIRAFRKIARVLKPNGLTAHSCDFYVKDFNTFRTYHRELLSRIILGLVGTFVPVDEPDYSIADPVKYYIENNTIYGKPEEREEKHLKYLREGKAPENLFTCASLVLRKVE